MPTPLSQFPARSIRHPEPYGVVLIMGPPGTTPSSSPWRPLIGAISAGNCAVLKPSAYAPACSHALKELISACLPQEWVTVVEGGRAENQALLEQPFDYIFFTGSVAVGRHVMEMAARNLTPVTLELGGKSPVIVTADADLPLAARRIIFGKLLNAGQTCVAPDYLLVERSVQEKLTGLLQQEITHFLGQTPLDHPDYPRIINEKHLRRLEGLLTGGRIVCGGTVQNGRIAPTLMDNLDSDAPIMQEEIFGPILPILPFDTLEEAMDYVSRRPKPLALYLFSRDKEVQKKVLTRLSFGGGCLNDTIVHLTSPHLPSAAWERAAWAPTTARPALTPSPTSRASSSGAAGPTLPCAITPIPTKRTGCCAAFSGNFYKSKWGKFFVEEGILSPFAYIGDVSEIRLPGKGDQCL